MAGYAKLEAYVEWEESAEWDKIVQETFKPEGEKCYCDWCKAMRQDKFPEAIVSKLGPKGKQAFIRCWIMKQEGKKIP